MIFSYFFFQKKKTVKAICMKCQNQFPGKNKKIVSICRLLKILLRVLSVNVIICQLVYHLAKIKIVG